jgi:hypothetical protein
VGPGQFRSERAARREVEPLDMSLVPEVVLPDDMVLVSVDEPLVTVVVPATGAALDVVPDELVLLGMLDDVLLVLLGMLDDVLLVVPELLVVSVLLVVPEVVPELMVLLEPMVLVPVPLVLVPLVPVPAAAGSELELLPAIVLLGMLLELAVLLVSLLGVVVLAVLLLVSADDGLVLAVLLLVSADDVLLSRDAQPTAATVATATATRLKRRDNWFMVGLLWRMQRFGMRMTEWPLRL